MSNPIQSVVMLSRAIDQAGDVLASVHDDQLSLPTPCADWDVGRLVSHLVADPRHFLELASGRSPDWSDEPERVLYWAATFRSAGDDLLHHWHQQGDAAASSDIDLQVAEFAVHAWDLVRATGQDVSLDPEVAEHGLAFLTTTLTDDRRGGAFGPPQPAPDDAPAPDRLAAFAGRPLA